MSSPPAPPIFVAAFHGRLLEARTLLDGGVDVNSERHDGLTPLIAASQQGHFDMAELLLDRGARVQPRPGVTSALQEDHLCHATPAALKALKILDNAEHIVAIELLAATQAYDLLEGAPTRAPATEGLHQRVRQLAPTYADDRPLAEDIGRVRTLISRQWPNP